MDDFVADTAFASDGCSTHCPIVLFLIFQLQQPKTVLRLLREHDPAATDRTEAQLRHTTAADEAKEAATLGIRTSDPKLLKSQLPVESLRPPELYPRWRAQTPKLELPLIQARQQERGTPERAVLATPPRESVAIAGSGTDGRSISNLRQ